MVDFAGEVEVPGVLSDGVVAIVSDGEAFGGEGFEEAGAGGFAGVLAVDAQEDVTVAADGDLEGDGLAGGGGDG